MRDSWAFVNVPPQTDAPNTGLCNMYSHADQASHGGAVGPAGESPSDPPFDPSMGCGFQPSAAAGHECDAVHGGPGAAMRDHEIFATTWSTEEELWPPSRASVDGGGWEGGPILNARTLALSTGEPVSPLVWSAALRSPSGAPLARFGRYVNRTEWYRCKPTNPATKGDSLVRGQHRPHTVSTK